MITFVIKKIWPDNDRGGQELTAAAIWNKIPSPVPTRGSPVQFLCDRARAVRARVNLLEMARELR